jgi:glycosyltransferase involved in cell wall biosynthesis
MINKKEIKINNKNKEEKYKILKIILIIRINNNIIAIKVFFLLIFIFFYIYNLLFNKFINEEYFASRDEAFKNALPFLNKTIQGLYINDKDSFKQSYFPKVSAIIAVYNSKNLILRSIRSIQNQNLLDIEIILVNDCSTDDTLSFLKSLKIDDPRIKIINNKKNMGILYTRSIGVLSAKGEYIFFLDNDDMFLDNDIFLTISNIANKGNYDIVEFKGIIALEGKEEILEREICDTPFSHHPINLVLEQPDLGRFPIVPGNSIKEIDLNSVFVWGKCIKTNIYKKALKKLKIERFSRYMLRHEDIAAMAILFNTAQSYKFIGKYGIFYINRNDSASRKGNETEIYIYNLYITDILIDFTQNRIQNKIVIVHFIMNLLTQEKFKEILNINYNYKKLFISCLNRLFSTKLISKKLKNQIKIEVEKSNLTLLEFKS